MDRINKAAAAGVIFFMVILAGFVGIKVDQVTIALLGGAFIGIVVAIPTTALIMWIGNGGFKRKEQPPPVYHYHDQRRDPPAPAFPQQMPYPNPQLLQEGWGGRVVHPQQQAYLPEPIRHFYVIGDGGEVKEIEPPRSY